MTIREVRAVALFILLVSGIAFAGVRDACHTENKDFRIFAVAYTGAVIDLN
jgi:hypothetical protein